MSLFVTSNEELERMLSRSAAALPGDPGSPPGPTESTSQLHVSPVSGRSNNSGLLQHLHSCTHKHVRTHTSVHTHMRTHTCVHTHMHTYTHFKMIKFFNLRGSRRDTMMLAQFMVWRVTTKSRQLTFPSLKCFILNF